MRVRIFGAGVAGLAAAVALRRRAGLEDVVVYERDSHGTIPVRLGHGLLLMQNGLTALRALGCESLLDGFSPLHTALLQDDRGLLIRRDDLAGVYCVTRAGLVERLRAQLPRESIVFGSHCTRIQVQPCAGDPRRRRVSAVRFASHEVLAGDDADLWIGAEGVRSVMCGALNPGLERPESRVWEIVTSSKLPELASQLRGKFVKTYFPSKGLAFGLLPATGEDVIGFLQFDRQRHPFEPNASATELKRFLLEMMASAPALVTSYLAQADFSTAHLWRPLNADVPGRLSCDNALLLGDAAHPVLPFTSQGVSAALEDAVMLADAIRPIANAPDALPATLAGFCEDRRRDVSAFIDGGRRILAEFVDESAPIGSPYVDGAVSKLEEHLALPVGELMTLLRLFDIDGDGLLDHSELHQSLQLLGISASPHEEETLFRELDADGDGHISQDELLSAVAASEDTSSTLRRFVAELSPRRVALHSLRGRATRLFQLMDSDRNGRVDMSEFAGYATLLGVAPASSKLAESFGDMTDADGAQMTLETFLDGIQRIEDKRRSRASVPPLAADDPLFADDQVNFAVLRERAFNYRWATLPDGVIPLTAADQDFPVATVITEAVSRYIRDGHLSYGPAEGLPLLREGAAERLRHRRGIPCDYGQIMVTDSAASALFLAAKLIIDQPGAEAIIPDPVDFLLERSVVAAGGVVKRVSLRKENGYAYDLDELERAITPRTRLISICNPHNPLGRVWSRTELEAIVEIALRHNLRILSDEVWADIVHAPSTLTSVAALGPEAARITFSVFGFSKGYGLAGLRVGLLVSPDLAAHQRIVAMSHAQDTAYGVSTLSQVAAAAAYRSGDPWLDRFVRHLGKQRDYAVSRLNALPGVSCHSPEGTFVAFPDVSSLDIAVPDFVERLKTEYQLAVVPGSPVFFGPAAEGHVRISFATSRGILSQGLDRFEACVRALPLRP